MGLSHMSLKQVSISKIYIRKQMYVMEYDFFKLNDSGIV